MKKIINGRLYNTDTATSIGGWCNGYSMYDFNYCEEILYRKKTGEFFLYGKGGARSSYAESCGDCWCSGENIIPFTYEEAKEWAMLRLSADEFLEHFECEE